MSGSRHRPPAARRVPARRLLMTAVTVAAVLSAACSSPSGTSAAPAEDGGGTLTVLAAASLTDAFGEVADDFAAQHGGVHVVLSFGGSSSLAQQVLAGAPADLLAVAAPEALDPVLAAGQGDGDPVVFARNAVALAVPTGNPGGVSGLADLADPDLTVALCAPQVPCGAAAERALAAAGTRAEPDTLERDVRAVLTKVRFGEVDAGVVYRTDVVAASGAVHEIDLPERERVSTSYPVVVLAGSTNRATARAFVAHLRSPAGQEVLRRAGFTTP